MGKSPPPATFKFPPQILIGSCILAGFLTYGLYSYSRYIDSLDKPEYDPKGGVQRGFGFPPFKEIVHEDSEKED